MRRLEWRWLVVVAAALTMGALGATSYAQAMAPFYRAAASWVARGRPWIISEVEVSHQDGRPGTFLRLHGEARKSADAARPAALLATRIQVGAVVEGPLIFWTLLLLWPAASGRRRLALIVCGIPVCLALETSTTVCQLLNGFAEGSALLAGASNPLTAWERWSRFLESGGRDVVAVCAALFTIAVASRVERAASTRPPT
jgi:hypothetical protein